MTERERWVVYPLLFLALGAALRDKLVDRTTTKTIVCQELAVVDEETVGRQTPRVLARIGRSESNSGGEADGYLMINGHMEIVDGDLASIPQPRELIEIGRKKPSPGAPVIGYAAINGQLIVDGLINARQYAVQGIPFMPTLQLLPGVSIPDVLRALQQSGQSHGTVPQAQPPANEPKKGRKAAPPPSPAGDQPPPPK